MNKFYFVSIISVISLLFFGWKMRPHPIHIGVTELYLNEKEKRVEVMIRLFTDDLEEALRKRYNIHAFFDTPKQHPQVNEYIKKYLEENFKLTINKKVVNYRFVGRETEADAQWIYAEVAGINKWNSVRVRNELLFDLFDDQEHFVHLKAKGLKAGGKLSRRQPEREWLLK